MTKTTLLGVILGTFLIGSGFYFISSQYLTVNETSLTILSPRNTYLIDEDVPISIILTTQTVPNVILVDGADVFIEFDPTFLSLEETASSSNTVDRYLTGSDSVFNNYPGALLKTEGNKMVFAFSAVKAFAETFNGLGTVGTIHFKALQIGTTTLKIQAVKGMTNDSNVASVAGDVLDVTKDLNLTIATTTPKGK